MPVNSSLRAELTLEADVLVIGGGPAGAWAALTAAREGARVVLVDKGYCGTSGVAATAGVGHWAVPPDETLRGEAMALRTRLGGFITDPVWQARVLDETWRRLEELGRAGYPTSRDDAGGSVLRIGQAPHYMRFMRGLVQRAGVSILDHSPAFELLADPEGTVAGARGIQRQKRRTWEVRAGAVVVATGGCTWKSKSLGGDVNTGDGQLFAAEVGARLSGMEFSSFFGIVPKGTSMDKNGYFGFATFTRDDGSPIEGQLFGSRAPLLKASLDGGVYAQFDRAPEHLRPVMRAAMPNFFMVMDKIGADPFARRFAIDFVLEGTVRGTGGLRVVDSECWTGVPGLFAAGDTASREVIVGGATGAGAPNAAWAVSSGTWAGRAAARHGQLVRGRRADLVGTGGAGIRPAHGAAGAKGAWRELLRAVQAETHSIEINVFRTDERLRRSLAALDGLWRGARTSIGGELDEQLRVRECAAMIAMARWSYASALVRTETRAMHTREDYPATDEAQQHRIVSGGLDDVWATVDAAEGPCERLAS